MTTAWLDRAGPQIPPADGPAMAAASAHLDQLTKPPGSLGGLETIAIRLAGIRGRLVTDIERPAVIVFAADHGVAARGVSAYPSEVTAQMVANFAAGGAAINVLARAAGAGLVVVDIGVAGGNAAAVRTELPGSSSGARLIHARIASGTQDFASGPAMTRDQALAAIETGRVVAADLIEDGADLLAIGEMGIGNTTSASAIVAALTGEPVRAVTGRGTGVDDPGLDRKVAVIDAALALHQLDPEDPIGVLAAVGGFEIAGLVGAILAAATARVPAVLDGFITGAAALVASGLAPNLPDRLLAAHRSLEPGHAIVLDRLGLRPILELDLRLGEGSGAALAIPIIRAAARICGEMATFEQAGVSGSG
ncbi:MAG TPA: nicotinate-nucleotide--dimethylbenzimidazole phosphoribosyltransferase [Candidatus Acidoferrum sp.]|nr:nicotinate-nucleotide--dimethylbenzimidazole phosphoribosyltransferase [Candidatus Acidoferrum sp.]